MGCSFGSSGILGNGESVIARDKLRKSIEIKDNPWFLFYKLYEESRFVLPVCDVQWTDPAGNGGEAADVTKSRVSAAPQNRPSA